MSDGTPMNVPPLCTVAVRAIAHTPSPRLPRKKPLRNEPLLTARCATTPIQPLTPMMTTSANITPYDEGSSHLFIRGPRPSLDDLRRAGRRS